MRISDWSSDVCSSDLPERIVCPRAGRDQLSLGRGLEVRPAKRQDALKTAVLVEDHARRDERRPRQVIGEPLGALAILAEEHHDPAFSMRKARKSGVEGKSVEVRDDLGGRRIIK